MEDAGFFIHSDETAGVAKLTVYKSARCLELSCGGRIVARVRAALGRGAGPKRAEGDGRTPEGVYAVCVRNEKSKYHLSLFISYPNGEDAKRGLEAGLIGAADCERIAAADRQGIRPPWDTPLGGEIMIHGGGSHRDWTAGCIALDDGDMDFVWKHAGIGTVVEILP